VEEDETGFPNQSTEFKPAAVPAPAPPTVAAAPTVEGPVVIGPTLAPLRHISCDIGATKNDEIRGHS
jgi:hypothetical protein